MLDMDRDTAEAAMACGNNDVTRAGISSGPESLLQHLARLFDRTPQPLNNETRLAEGDVMVQNGKGKYIISERRYSGINANGKVDRFLDSNRNETLNTQLHIHEFLHPDKGDVRGKVEMHITDRRGGGAAQHTHKIVLPEATGNDVNAAEERLASIMRAME